ncbi:Transposon TX1 uncharacterized 149 kDa protein [Linum perenne]
MRIETGRRNVGRQPTQSREESTLKGHSQKTPESSPAASSQVKGMHALTHSPMSTLNDHTSAQLFQHGSDEIAVNWAGEQNPRDALTETGQTARIHSPIHFPPTYNDPFLNLSPPVLHKPNNVQILQNYRDREEVWQSILAIDRDVDFPWCLIGDFNAIRNPKEKEGNRPPNIRSMRELNNFLEEARLVDIAYVGARYTWSNNQEGTAEVKQRIDRGFCNTEWASIYPNGFIIHKARTESDHCPILLQFESNGGTKGLRRFYYEKGWKEAEGYQSCVDQAWRRGVGTNENLKMLSKSLTSWKREAIGVNKDHIVRLLAQLQNLNEQTSTPQVQEEERTVRETLRRCWQIEECYWAQRARVKWLELGDKNTSFFHASTVQRRRRNTIRRLMNEDGSWLDEQDEMMQHVTDFYKNLFTEERRVVDYSVLQGLPQTVGDTRRASLDRPINEWEIKNAVFQLGPTKSPGPDGFPGCFYREHWTLVKDELIKEILDFSTTFKAPILTHVLFADDTVIFGKAEVSEAESIGQLLDSYCCISGQAGTRSWKLEKLRSIFQEETVKEIRMIPIGPPTMEDKWLWHKDRKGRFSVKSCYRLMKEGHQRPRNPEELSRERDWRWLWQLPIPSKVKLFLWRGCCNLLPTRKNLHRRKCCEFLRLLEALLMRFTLVLFQIWRFIVESRAHSCRSELAWCASFGLVL